MIVRDFENFRVNYRWNEELRDQIDLIPRYVQNPQVIVDFGSGHGRAAALISEKFPNARIVAVDIEDKRVYAKDVLFVRVDKDNPHMKEIQSESVDAVFARYVLEHVNNLTATLLEFFRILTKHGIVVIAIPNFTHLRGLIYTYFLKRRYRMGGKLEDTGHRNMITPKFLRHFVSSYFDMIYEGGSFWDLPLPLVKSKFRPPRDHLLYAGIKAPDIAQQHWHWVKLSSRYHPLLSLDYVAVLRKKR